MSKVEARLGRVECTVRVSWAPETVNRSTVIAVPESVQWEAFLYGATWPALLRSPRRSTSSRLGHPHLDRGPYQVCATLTVFGQDVDGEQSNATFFPDFEDVPSWIPAPPAWYVDAVAELRAAGEDLSKGVSR